MTWFWLCTLVILLAITCYQYHKNKQLKQQLKSLNLNRSHLQALVDSIPDLTWVKDLNSRFLMVNQQFTKAFGLKTEEIIGKTDFDLSDPTTAKRYADDDKEVINSKQSIRREESITGEDGIESWAETVKVPVFNEQGQVIGTAGMARDISERKLAERHIRHLAHHDQLTQLPNRTLLEYRFKRYIAKHNPASDQLGVIFIDLDNFKVINDTISHNIGDQILIEIAKRLRNSVRKQDTVARIGGDEFVVLLPYTTVEQSIQVAEKLRAKLAHPIVYDNLSFEVTPSCGLAMYPDNGDECWGLVQNADLAMYHSKQSGKDRLSIFSRQLADQLIDRMTLDRRLKDALENNELSVVYQPKVNIITGKLIGFEALTRWFDPKLQSWISPTEFIPVAEQSGFILKLGEWLLDTVAQQLNAWNEQGYHQNVAINISAPQVHQSLLVHHIEQVLEIYSLNPKQLELELTESVVMENSESIRSNLQILLERGIAISIDDFGTGYSSLAYLSRFPVNTLKIDRMFVQDIHLREESQQITRAIVEMAKALELKVIAEGIETVEELTTLRTLGIEQAQGFLFDQPLIAKEAFERFSKDHEYSQVKTQPIANTQNL